MEFTMALISFSSVSKVFRRSQGLRTVPVQALCEVSFEIKPGEFVGLIGHNGAGKSTAIKLLMGFIHPNAGEVRVRGMEPSDVSTRRSLGYVPESASFSDFLTGRELLQALGSVSRLSRSDSAQRAVELLEALDITHAADRPVRTYSKGMTQRLALAQSLIARPDVLILDEPMTGLDPLGRRQVLDVLTEELKRGVSLLFCSHLLSDVQELCERVLWLHQGRVQYDGPVRELVEDRAHFELIFRAPKPIRDAVALGKEIFRLTLQPEDLQGAITEVAAAGGRVESFRPVTRALEDVFLQKVSR
jgi:ABC-2 type transport system ATP-binding protein